MNACNSNRRTLNLVSPTRITHRKLYLQILEFPATIGKRHHDKYLSSLPSAALNGGAANYSKNYPLKGFYDLYCQVNYYEQSHNMSN